MSDIFISYSRKDSAQTLAFAERLRNSGLSVWIDQQGIEAASSWSKEIVSAIRDAKVVVLMLSSNSLASNNVVKELSIASEKGKVIIPVELESVTLTDDFEYQLAGIQRVGFSDHAAILRAVSRYVESVASTTNERAFATPARPRKRNVRATWAAVVVMLVLAVGGYLWYSQSSATMDDYKIVVLPFHDLSSQKDSDLLSASFSDDLHEALEEEKELTVVPRSATMEYASSALGPEEIAVKLGARFAVEGAILTIGDSLFVEVKLRDCISLKDLHRKKYAGVLRDVFELHALIAEEIRARLHVRTAI